MRGEESVGCGSRSTLLTGVLSLVLPPPAPPPSTVSGRADHDRARAGPRLVPRRIRHLLPPRMGAESSSQLGQLAPEDTDRCEDVRTDDDREIDLFRVRRRLRALRRDDLAPDDRAERSARCNSPVEHTARGGVAGRHPSVLQRRPGSLVAEDTDSASDAYERTAGVTTLSRRAAGQGPVTDTERMSEDGGAGLLHHERPLLSPRTTTSASTSTSARHGTTKLVSTGVPPVTRPDFHSCADLPGGWASRRDGSRVFLQDECASHRRGRRTASTADIYEWSDGGVALITTGPADDPEGGILHTDVAISRDGRHVFFRTSEKLVP